MEMLKLLFLFISVTLISCHSGHNAENTYKEDEISRERTTDDTDTLSPIVENSALNKILIGEGIGIYKHWYSNTGFYGGLYFLTQKCDTTFEFDYIQGEKNKTYCRRTILKLPYDEYSDTIAIDIVQGLELQDSCDMIGGRGPTNYYPKIVDLTIVSPDVDFFGEDNYYYDSTLVEFRVNGKLDFITKELGQPDTTTQDFISYSVKFSNEIRTLRLYHKNNIISAIRFIVTNDMHAN